MHYLGFHHFIEGGDHNDLPQHSSQPVGSLTKP